MKERQGGRDLYDRRAKSKGEFLRVMTSSSAAHNVFDELATTINF
jgi:hypothetical protein